MVSRKKIEGLILSDSLYNFKNNVVFGEEDIVQYIYDYAFYIDTLKSEFFFNDAVKLQKVLLNSVMMHGITEDYANRLINESVETHRKIRANG